MNGVDSEGIILLKGTCIGRKKLMDRNNTLSGASRQYIQCNNVSILLLRRRSANLVHSVQNKTFCDALMLIQNCGYISEPIHWVRGSNPGGGEIFRTCAYRPRWPTQRPTQSTPGLFPGGEAIGVRR
jgi:hypothetical protein